MHMTDAQENVSNFGSPDARRCGAKTRCGAPCRNLAVRHMKRCRMHGGKSLDGIAHPNYKHACYSKHSILGIVMRAEVRAYRELKRKRARFDKMLAAEAALRAGERLATMPPDAPQGF